MQRETVGGFRTPLRQVLKPAKTSINASYTVALPCPAAPSQATVSAVAILPYCHIKENGCSPSVIAAASQCLQKEKYPHFLFRFLRDCLKTLWYRRLPDLPSPHPRRRWSFQSR